MILWVALFLIVVAISFILAFRSMRDFQEIPHESKEEYGLFLIRQTHNFNTEVLDSILKHLYAKGLILSIERLFKGSQSALTLFGPKTVLHKFSSQLDLLELEDYASNLDNNHVSVWEMGVRGTDKSNPDSVNNIFDEFPKLEEEDQFFWQVIPGKDQTQIRAAIYTKDPVRRNMLLSLLQNLKLGGLVKLPKPFSNEQMMSFYRLRSLNKNDSSPVLSSEEVIHLLKIS